MKLILPRIPPLFARKKKKLRVNSARRASASGAEFDELGEPNMKLSRALLMVLLLHVVAVGGIVAFNAIKSRHDSPIPASNSAKVRYSVNATPAASPLPSVNGTTEKKSPPEKTKTYIVAKGDTLVTIAKKFRVPSDELLAVNHIDEPRKLKVGQKLTIPIKKPIAKKATD